MRFTATEIAVATGGRLVGPDTESTGLSIDTRTIQVGDLFVPIVGDRDGHDYIAVALAAGAACYLTDREPVGGSAIVVDDTMQALTALGRAARSRHEGPVIAITGSVGKTSVKDLTAAAVGGTLRTHASERSFNNELGVPITLCTAPEDAEVLIVEMGARGIGHIAELCEIARPTIGVVTWVGAVHTSEFGSLEAVAQAKGELVVATPASGTVILNADCAPVRLMRSDTEATVIMYGEAADVSALDVVVDEELRPSFDVIVGGRSYAATMQVHGVHQVSNALAAIAAAHAVGVEPEAAIKGLQTASVSPWRMELHHVESGATIINDAYNANVISTAAALESLSALAADRRIAVLGTMAELGERHDEDHQTIAEMCGRLGIQLLAYREAAYGSVPLTDFSAVVEAIGPIGPGDALLIKGSRVAELEALAELLIGS